MVELRLWILLLFTIGLACATSDAPPKWRRFLQTMGWAIGLVFITIISILLAPVIGRMDDDS